MIVDLLNVPSSPEDFSTWSFSHQDQHMKIVNAIFQKFGLNTPVYILDPMPDVKSPQMATWAEIHQQAHTQFDDILGIEGSDLTSVDFSQQDQVESWVRLNFDEHNSALTALNFPD